MNKALDLNEKSENEGKNMGFFEIKGLGHAIKK